MLKYKFMTIKGDGVIGICSKNFLKVTRSNAMFSLLEIYPNKIFLSAESRFFIKYIGYTII